MKATEKTPAEKEKSTVKPLKNSSVNENTVAHTLTFSLVFLIQEILDEVIYPWLQAAVNKAVYIAITGVVALVLYFLVYAAIEFAYHRIYAKFDKYPKIEGVWYHVHIPKHFESGGEDYQHTKLSVGRTEICREWSVFTFEGENDRCTVSNGQLVFLNEAKTEWRTKATELSPETDTEIIEVYGAETGTVQNHTVDVCPCCKTAFKKPVSIPEAGQNRFGVHRLKLKADGHMEGSYSDCYPSLKSGTVYFYRTKEERNARVRQYFAIAEKLRAQNGDGQQ